MIKKTFLITAICITFPMTLHAEKARFVVTDFRGIGVPAATSVSVSEMIRTELSNYRKIEIVEKYRVDAVFKEIAFQQTGCTNTECAVKVGTLLEANKTIVGTVTKFDSTYIISGRLIDVRTGAVDASRTEKVTSENGLIAAARSFTESIAKEYKSEEDISTEKYPLEDINPANHDLILSLGYDVWAQHVYTRMESGDIETDVNKSYSGSISYIYSPFKYFGFGAGVTLQFPRKVKDTVEAQFSITPVYGILRAKLPQKDYCPYIIGQAGYNNFGDTKEYANTRGGTLEIGMNADGNHHGGLYYGLGVGVILYDVVLIQAMFEESRATFETQYIGTGAPWGVKKDSSVYRKVVVSMGVVF